ncbi:FRG domain-containing protein [Ralstonia holmesii]|uniref:FRG domain-containing protein n=1 Tax=Ralstonia holmesii TaxID=3058602 RepID=UPI003F6CA761
MKSAYLVWTEAGNSNQAIGDKRKGAAVEELITEQKFASLDEFWDALSPIGKIFGNPLTKFIYRGQSDGDWKLVPQVYRQAIIDRYRTGMHAALGKDHIGQTHFEWWLLESFLYHSDQRGLAIPGDSMEFRKFFEIQNIMTVNGIANHGWPQMQVLPMMAMAQHHGIPTRLLDWSSNAMVACYFAAAGAVNKPTPQTGQTLAVFGFTFNSYRREVGFRHVRVPGSTSANLSAQGGSFILVNNNGYRGEEFAIDADLESTLNSTDRLIKLTLPIELAGELLMRCHKFGFSAATVFPGYDGAAKAVLERQLAVSFLERLV